jgi:hypothetical protein
MSAVSIFITDWYIKRAIDHKPQATKLGFQIIPAANG